MTTYKELKSVRYFDSIIAYAKKLLNIEFQSTGRQRYSAFCPFHNDSKDSFRVYVDSKDEVRFHCFGECNTEWDIYDIIIKVNKCSFREAQETFAEYMGIKDFVPYGGIASMPDEENKLDEPVNFVEPKELDKDVITALHKAAAFYHEFLLQKEDKALKYLYRRGLDIDLIKKFNIGYASPFADEDYIGRALIYSYLDRFNEDYKTFYPFVKAGLFRFLDDKAAKGYGYYMQQIDFSRTDPFTKAYGDFFAGRITFPIYDINGKIHGFMGRRPDNRGTHWIKQQKQDTEICTRGWLYGIDKAARYIEYYTTIIIVEGIFDYFAFYRLLQDTAKPFVVSTLGTRLTDETISLLQQLNIKNIIVAYDWDNAGRAGINKIAKDLDCTISYLGGMKPDEDPADKLKNLQNIISGFSLKHLSTAARKIQKQTDKPVGISFLSSSSPKPSKEILFKPDTTLDVSSIDPQKPGKAPEKYFYEADRFLPLLTYNHANKADLDSKIQDLIKMLNERPEKPGDGNQFTIYSDFIRKELYDDMGPALILWLRIVIEQQYRKRKIKETDSTLAKWLQTSRPTIIKYKGLLNELGFLTISNSTKYQILSVKYFIGKQV
ncbi:MAG: toprim domain-containing protein [Desulfobacterales bacterium]|nr:toprim domain-containing protein [Desulfobacterales bacterium]